MSDAPDIIAEIDWNSEPEYEGPPDQRKGLPSASEYPRMWACPGYLNLKREQPKKESGPPSAYALSGQKIHAALAGDSAALKLLDDDEEQCYDFCGLQWESLTKRFLVGIPFEVISEQRIFLGDEFSGQFDRTAVSTNGEIALTVDFKTGRIAVPSAENNLQMRAYAVLLAQQRPSLKRLLVAVIQPWVSKDPIVAEYDADTLRQSRRELDAVLHHSKDPEAKRIPGPHCKYCPCRKDCEEGRAVVVTVSRTSPAKLVTNQQIAEFLELVPIAESVIEAVKKEAELRILAGEDVPGWELAPSRSLSTITKPEVVFARVSALGLTHSAFMSAVKLGKTKLKDELKVLTGLKGKGLEQQLAEVLEGCTEDKPSKSYLKKKGVP